MPKSSCPTCGQPTDESVHTLSRSLIRLLYTAYRSAGRGGFQPSAIRVIRPADSSIGAHWTHSQRANFQKLQYWSLIEPHQSDAGYKMRGWWRVTQTGYDFIRNAIALQRKAITFNKSVRRHEGERVFVPKITGGWQYYADYVRESQPQALTEGDKQMLFQEAP